MSLHPMTILFSFLPGCCFFRVFFQFLQIPINAVNIIVFSVLYSKLNFVTHSCIVKNSLRSSANGLSISNCYPLKHKTLRQLWNSFFQFMVEILGSASLLTGLCKQKGSNLMFYPSLLTENSVFLQLLFFLVFLILSSQSKNGDCNLLLCPQFK